MRAARLHELGSTPRVDEIDAPEGPNVIAVSAGGLNPVDAAIGSGRFYGGSPQTPYVIGSEGVGIGADGRHVWFRGSGTIAEQAVAAEGQTFDIPEGVGDDLALACGIAGLTGWLAVAWRAQVTADDTVLVLGASGSVGATAVQGAKLLGARRVVGAARETDRVPAAADATVELGDSYELPEATVVIDALWGTPAERALEAAAHGVRFVQLGQSAGPTAVLKSAWVRSKLAEIRGHSLFSTPHDVIANGYRELCEHAREGRIHFEIEAFGLDDVAAAWERQASGSPGAKIVVRIESAA
jgi:NADPH:quinone reductase-like Zn-dependent oxidoreductase